MNKQQVEALFPLEAWITPAIIEVADVNNATECIGALTLRSALGLSLVVGWVTYSGVIFTDDAPVDVTTYERINMMKVTEPQKVTFVLSP